MTQDASSSMLGSFDGRKQFDSKHVKHRPQKLHAVTTSSAGEISDGASKMTEGENVVPKEFDPTSANHRVQEGPSTSATEVKSHPRSSVQGPAPELQGEAHSSPDVPVSGITVPTNQLGYTP